MRTVQLAGVRVGFQNPPDWDRPGAYGVMRDPALAVDPTGRAFVIAGGDTVAEVDLASLQATYRRRRQPASLLRRLAHWLVPSAEAKLVAGTWRSACWLGEETLAVWGGGNSVTGDSPASQRMLQRPSGIKLIDTRTWTIRPPRPAAGRPGGCSPSAAPGTTRRSASGASASPCTGRGTGGHGTSSATGRSTTPT
jgi:hypothetical protein